MSKERTPTLAELKAIIEELTACRFEWTNKAYFDRQRGRMEAALFDEWVSGAYQHAAERLRSAIGGAK